MTYRHPRWKAWLGLFLVVPLAAASGALLFGLCRHVVTGQLTTVVKGYGYSSRIIVFAESPAQFVVFFLFHALFAVAVLGVTAVVARMSLRRLREP